MSEVKLQEIGWRSIGGEPVDLPDHATHLQVKLRRYLTPYVVFYTKAPPTRGMRLQDIQAPAFRQEDGTYKFPVYDNIISMVPERGDLQEARVQQMYRTLRKSGDPLLDRHILRLRGHIIKEWYKRPQLSDEWVGSQFVHVDKDKNETYDGKSIGNMRNGWNKIPFVMLEQLAEWMHLRPTDLLEPAVEWAEWVELEKEA